MRAQVKNWNVPNVNKLDGILQKDLLCQGKLVKEHIEVLYSKSRFGFNSIL